MTLVLAEIVAELEELSGETGIDPDAPLADLPIDSLVLIEWLYTVEEVSGVPLIVACQDFENLEDVSVRRLCAHLDAWGARESEPAR